MYLYLYSSILFCKKLRYCLLTSCFQVLSSRIMPNGSSGKSANKFAEDFVRAGGLRNELKLIQVSMVTSHSPYMLSSLFFMFLPLFLSPLVSVFAFLPTLLPSAHTALPGHYHLWYLLSFRLLLRKSFQPSFVSSCLLLLQFAKLLLAAFFLTL